MTIEIFLKTLEYLTNVLNVVLFLLSSLPLILINCLIKILI